MSFKSIFSDNNKVVIGIIGIIMGILLYMLDSRFLLIATLIAPILLVLFKTNKNLGIISLIISIGCLIAGIYNSYMLLFVYIPRGYMYGLGGSYGLMPVKIIFSFIIIIYSLFCSYCLLVSNEYPNVKLCSECGNKISDKDKFCPKCGITLKK